MFRLKLFGSASITGPDGPVTGRAVQRRRLGLFALLALARERGVTRDKLIGYLWPDSDPDRARHLLSDSVYRINQAVGGDAVIAIGDDLRLNPERLSSDAWDFADALDRGEWQRAVELQAAPFLDGFFLTDADELERWVDAQRERLTRERARAIEALAEAAERADAFPEAVHWWRSLAAYDPLSSRVALRLMRALERTGDRAAALQHARIHAALLEEELGLAPDADVLAAVEQLRAPRPAPASSTPAPARPPGQQSAVHETMTAETDHASMDARPPEPPSRRRPRLAHVEAVLIAVALIVAGVVALLRARPAAVAAAPQAVAVLPFADLSEGGAYEYFADGMTEELIVRLAQVEGLAVVGRTSSFAFKGRAVDVRDIAAQLNVSAVIEGSVRHSGDSVRIVARLTDARNGYQLWSETYDRRIQDVLAIQEEISRAIATRLHGSTDGLDVARFTGRDEAAENPEAFNLYLKGRYEWHRRTAESLRTAAEYFDQAIEHAPDYARAHAGLADAYAVLGFYDVIPPREAFPAAARSARRALTLDDSMGEAHATLGYVALYHDWDWSESEREFRRAIELEPAYSTAHQWYANFLTAMGRFDEAVAEMGRAMELDPLSVIANAALGWVLYYAGDYGAAVAQCTRALELDPRFALAYLWRAQAREELGDVDAALLDFERSVQLASSAPLNIALHARALANAGRRERALALLRQLEQREGSDYVPPYEMAKIYNALGDTPAALASLERAYEHRSHSIAFLAVDPQLARLHAEPRFRSLVERTGLDRTPGGRRLAAKAP
ncbi:MAG TPA: BTAD domain-containing putative transcriptional regulator [Longimicrobiales bacterium]